MLWLELLMVLIGLIAVIVSFRLSDKRESKREDEKEPAESAFAESSKRQEEIIDELFEKFRRRVDNLVEETDENLGHLSNEKIMSLSEFSEQTLEKMQKNHDDVVFLYDMIEEKQQELKKLVHDVDLMRATLEDEAAAQYQQIQEKQDQLDSLKKDIELEALSVESGLRTRTELVSGESADGSDDVTDSNLKNSSIYDAEIARIVLEETSDVEKKPEENVSDGAVERKKLQTGGRWNRGLDTESANHNGEIIALYKKGRSILEISKMLSLGQGEVKFVIDLYHAG